MVAQSTSQRRISDRLSNSEAPMIHFRHEVGEANSTPMWRFLAIWHGQRG